MIKIVIITPIFNRSEYLRRLYDSIVDNILPGVIEFHWIICNDSPKESKDYIEIFKVVSELSMNYQEGLDIRYLDNEGNLGLTKTRNKMINCALYEIDTFDVLVPIDADDYLLQEFGELVAEFCVIDELTVFPYLTEWNGRVQLATNRVDLTIDNGFASLMSAKSERTSDFVYCIPRSLLEYNFFSDLTEKWTPELLTYLDYSVQIIDAPIAFVTLNSSQSMSDSWKESMNSGKIDYGMAVTADKLLKIGIWDKIQEPTKNYWIFCLALGFLRRGLEFNWNLYSIDAKEVLKEMIPKAEERLSSINK